MTNPLDDLNETFQTACDAINIARRVLDSRDDPVSNTGFYGLSQEEGHQILDRVQEQLNELIAFALFAAFERSLREHLSKSLSPIADSSTIPSELASKLHDFLEKRVARWQIDSLLSLFNPPVPKPDVDNARAIQQYRNSVAHGDVPPSAIPPITVYELLSDFLRNAGLVSGSTA